VVIFIGDIKKEKSKTLKDAHNPHWSDLNWTMNITLSEPIRLEIGDGMLQFKHCSDLVPIPVEHCHFTKPLSPQENLKKSRTIRGSITLELSFIQAETLTKQILTKKAHFKRSLREYL